MSDSVTITIPGTVDLDLGPNRSPHPRKRSRLRKELGERAWLATLAAGPITLQTPITMHIAVAWESKRRKTWDDDNLIGAMKAARDAIAATIGINDRDMRVGSVTQTYDDDGRGYIKVALEAEVTA